MTLQGLTNLCKLFIVSPVCVVQMRAVKNVSCPCLKPAGNHHRGASLTAFLLPQTALRALAVGLHGLLGAKHRLSFTPKQAVRTFNEVSGNTHRPIGGTSGAWKESLAQAALERQSVRLLGEDGTGLPPLGNLCFFTHNDLKRRTYKEKERCYNGMNSVQHSLI